MEIKERDIADLNPAEYNPRQLTDKQYKQLRKSLKTFGCVEPVVVNSNPMRKDVIIGGHQRCKVWRDLGNDTIPTIEIELGEAEEMELNVRLNKNTGQFDFDILANLFDMDALKDWGFESFEFGHSYDDDYAALEGEDMADILADMNGEVRKAIQIDFDLEDYEEASALVKQCRDKGLYVGKILMNALKRETNENS